MPTKTAIRGSVPALLVSLELHQESTGLAFEAELTVCHVSVSGWWSYTPSSYFEPSEEDSEVSVALDDAELLAALGEAAARAGLGSCTFLTPLAVVRDQLRELAEEAVLDDLESYLDCPSDD